MPETITDDNGVLIVTPENHNPHSIRPVSFDYPKMRRKYLRNYTEIDHHDSPDWNWPWVIALDADEESVSV